ncbi:MAG: protein tyrosine phosphatase-like domain-containing protein [Chitinophagales bacterium]|nr:protein tyrosine phosphatase-like domain-containing protein [Chitinophagales bacterium]
MKPFVRNYLALYNAAAFVCWVLYLVHFAKSGFTLTERGMLLLNIAQGLAVLEIVHAILKWVKSPVGSTIAQIGSRLLVVVLLNFFIREPALPQLTQAGIVIVSLAWGITELVRYSFYFLSLFNRQPYILLFMRYTFFIVLYPLGVTGEWFIFFHPLISNGITLSIYTFAILFIFIAYMYYFPVLYGYMWKQRNTKL